MNQSANKNLKFNERFRTGSVLFLSAIHLIHDIFTAFLAPLLPLLIQKHGISYSSAGFLSVIQRLPSLLNPFFGLLADKISLRYLVIITPAISSTMMSLIGVADSYNILLVLCFVTGLSSALFHVPSPVMIKEVSGNRIGKGMSFYMLGGELARTIGPLLIMATISIWGLEGTYRLIPFGLTSSFIMFLRFRKLKVQIDNKSSEKENLSGTIKSVMPFFGLISCIIFFRLLIKGALTTFLPVYLTSKGESLWFAGAALSIIQFSGAAGTLLSGTISDYMGRKKTLLIVSVIVPFLMFLFISSEGMISIFTLILLGIFLFASEPVLLAFVNEKKTKRPAFINGIYMGLNFGISAFSLMLVGFAGDKIGLELTYQITVFAGLLAIPFVFYLPKR